MVFCPFDISVGVGAFVIGLSQISSFFSQTGVRLVHCTILENDIEKYAYTVTIDGRMGLVSVPGRPPKCFRCGAYKE